MKELGITGGDEEKKRPTIGLICVSKEFQHRGVGADQVDQSQKLVTDVWKDDTLCAEVAESNTRAISFFFQSLGFAIR
jgi:ribosomal protein S18 acetylase RimI-like enzyme